jgi:hypothetical protein
MTNIKKDMLRLENQLLNQLIESARENFYIFVKMLAPIILPETFVDGQHIEIVCDELQAVAMSVEDVNSTPKRLQIMMPPGSMKSKIASNLFPAWCLGRHPNWCFLAIGSDFEFAVDNFGRPTKDLIDSPQYKAIFPLTHLKRDVQAAGRWDTTRKGRFVARGAGQNIAGRRAHITICGLSTNYVYEKTKGTIQLKDLKIDDQLEGPNGFESVTKSLVCHHELVYNINNEVETSPEHPFFVKGEGWVEAKDLRIGDKLIIGASLWTRLKKRFMIFGEV